MEFDEDDSLETRSGNPIAPASILIVDDSRENRFVLRTLLDQPDYHLVEAESGTEALKLLLSYDFALVIMDVRMPILDGFETAKHIRSRRKTKHLPIIFVTAQNTDQASMFNGYSVGAVDYLLTPIVPEILRAKVAVFVELYRKSEDLRRHEAKMRELEKLQYQQQLEAEKLKLREQYLLKESEQEKIANRKLAEQARLLADSNTELERFAHVISHDLQEPLNTVNSYCDLFEQSTSGKIADEAKESLNFIRNGVKRMSALVKGLLQFSKVKREDLAITEEVDLKTLFERTKESLSAMIHAHGAKVTCGKLPTVKGDEFQLGQVFQNLIANGIKFHGDRKPVVHVDAERDGSFWKFCVRDNGIGIDPKYFDHIFVIFKRLHRTEEYEGTGLGLALCKKIIESYGGKIWVESQLGSGSTFYFILPVIGDASKTLAA